MHKFPAPEYNIRRMILKKQHRRSYQNSSFADMLTSNSTALKTYIILQETRLQLLELRYMNCMDESLLKNFYRMFDTLQMFLMSIVQSDVDMTEARKSVINAHLLYLLDFLNTIKHAFTKMIKQSNNSKDSMATRFTNVVAFLFMFMLLIFIVL